MRINLNGRDVDIDLDAGETAVEVIRAQAGLTGTKLVCGTGVCGACTVLVDGTPMTSCLLPAHQLGGRRVRTVEAHAAAGLHPVQKAFMAHDALQCGFCTPGFVNEAVALYERWRQEQPRAGEAPSRDEIAAALAGHLCRCGAYPGIYDAVARACAGDYDADQPVTPARVDALAKVTGQAVYTVDVQDDGLLEGRLVRSVVAHARITAVDLDTVRAQPGVVAAVDLLSDDRTVRYVGQPIAALAATTARTAEHAARAAAVDAVAYDVLPFVVDPGEAVDAVDAVGAGKAGEAVNGTALVYEGRPDDPPNTAEGPIPPGRYRGNTRRMRGGRLLSSRARRARRLLAAAAAGTDPDLELVSGTWHTADQVHTALEPHAAVARWDEPDRLTLHVSTQTVDTVAREVAERYRIDEGRVTVHARYVGGAFGAKQGLGTEAVAAIELARATGTAVRVANDRLDEMAGGGHRPATRVDVDLVAGRSGELKALRIAADGHGGVGVNSSVALIGRLVYPKVPKLVSDRDVLTNTPPGKPFRAPFAPPLFWALEGSVDEAAHRLGIDPIELHRRWDHHPLRPHLYDWASRLDAWRERGPAGAATGRHRRGIGFAMGSWLNVYDARTVVEVSATPDGLHARTVTQDMGNGARTVMATAVAEVFGVPPAEVDVDIGRSGPPTGPGSTASRTTNAVWSPTFRAAEELRRELLAAARDELHLADVSVLGGGPGTGGGGDGGGGGGGVRHRDGTLSWTELVAKVAPRRATARRGTNGALDLLGRLPSGELRVNLARRMTSAVYVCEVVVDTRLGTVRVERVWGGFAVGKLVVPALARSQVHGGIVQGIGYTLYEERHLDPTTGTVLSLGLEEHRIPGIGDVPEIELFFHEGGFEHVKGGAAGLAEVSTIPVAAAVGNAVFHATGHRYRTLPLRPDRILEGLAQ